MKIIEFVIKTKIISCYILRAWNAMFSIAEGFYRLDMNPLEILYRASAINLCPSSSCLNEPIPWNSPNIQMRIIDVNSSIQVWKCLDYMGKNTIVLRAERKYSVRVYQDV